MISNYANSTETPVENQTNTELHNVDEAMYSESNTRLMSQRMVSDGKGTDNSANNKIIT